MSPLPLIAAVLQLAGTAYAAEPVIWSSTTYVSAVLEHSPDVKNARESLFTQRIGLKSQFAKDFLPTLGLSASMNPAELTPNARFTFDAWRLNANDVSVSPSLSWNLFNSFQDYLSLKSSHLSRESTHRDLDQTLQSRALSAVRGYYRMMLRRKLAQVSKRNRVAQREQYQLTKDRYKHGMKSLSDLLKTETDWRSAELDVETEEAQRRLSLFQFNIAIERDEDAEVNFPKALTLGTTHIPPLAEGLRRALVDRPEIKKNRISLERADVTYRQAILSAVPTMSLGFNYTDSYSAPFGVRRTPLGLGSAVYNFTLSVAFPSSFNFYSQVQDVRSARSAWRTSRNDATALIRRIRQEVYQAHINLSRALRSHQISIRKESISFQNLDLVKEQYSQGSADVIRLSQALRDYVNSQTERMRAFTDANIGHAEYRVAIGEPIWR